MNLDQLDQLLARLTEAEGAMSANLVELDGHPTTKLMQSAGLTGTTAARGLPAIKAIEDLWGQYAALHQLLQEGRELRGKGRRLDYADTTRLEQLLCGPSITLTGAQIPLSQRGLLGPTANTWQVSPGQLIQSMTGTFEQARDVIFAVDGLWRDLVPRLEEIKQQLAELEAGAAPLGVADQLGLPRLRVDVEKLGAQVVSDPMAVGEAFASSIEPALSTGRTTLRELTARHDSLRPDMARARTLVAELAQLRDEGAKALEETRLKITHPEGLLEPLDPDLLVGQPHGLAPWLDRLVAIVAGGRWQAGRRGLDQWLEQAEHVRRTALAVRDANRSPLLQRDELRGRLAAYQVKAAALGRGEDAQLAELYDAAHELLYSAPTDLIAAGDLVARYSAALQGAARRSAESGGLW